MTVMLMVVIRASLFKILRIHVDELLQTKKISAKQLKSFPVLHDQVLILKTLYSKA